MSDHLDAPGVKSPNMDACVDICDHFAFRNPEDYGRSVLVLNVNPFAPTLADSFSSEAVYELKIDTNGDAVAEDRVSCVFLTQRTWYAACDASTRQRRASQRQWQ